EPLPKSAASTGRVGSSSWRRCWPVRAEGPPRSLAHASCSTGRTPGAGSCGRPADGDARGAATVSRSDGDGAPMTLVTSQARAVSADNRLAGAIAAYLDHLRVERGLSPATIAAYANDLQAFGGSRFAGE